MNHSKIRFSLRLLRHIAPAIRRELIREFWNRYNPGRLRKRSGTQLAEHFLNILHVKITKYRPHPVSMIRSHNVLI